MSLEDDIKAAREKLLATITTESDRYAIRRKFSYKQHVKKISTEMLRQEIIIARILGELSGAERVLQSIVQNPEWQREDIEAELHFFIKDLNNVAATHLGANKTIDIEDILQIHGYFKKDEE